MPLVVVAVVAPAKVVTAAAADVQLAQLVVLSQPKAVVSQQQDCPRIQQQMAVLACERLEVEQVYSDQRR